MKYQIKVLKEIHYIEGNDYSATLKLVVDGEHDVTMPVAIKQKDFSALMDSVNGIKTRLELLGNEVSVDVEVWNDPNFESQEQADDYLMTKGY